MPVTLDPSDFLAASDSLPVVDVRSPAEYQQGHIPGAINIPLFNDQERAEVGTHFVQSGRAEAILRGLDITLPKTGKLLKSIREQASGNNLLVYCWRGGLRSLTMAWLFETNGYQVSLLEGGYKAYRRYIRNRLALPARVVVLGGYTGSGKTEVLNQLAVKGEQVIDLEQLASHRGSAFGGIGMPVQPTSEQFENTLYDRWRTLDPEKFIWLEDESRMIGQVTLPDPIIRKIQEYPLIILEVPKALRVERLVKEYSCTDDRYLQEAVMKIEARLGKPRVKGALICISRQEYAHVADEMLTYYDKAYLFSVNRRKDQPRYFIRIERFDAGEIATRLIDFAYTQLKNGPDLPGL
ncbi:MAG: tRNA 2-selenouridine(34) synthase MnmH [Bacteroidetes bacterium]|nr:MAG: tRNA 2-selenouridine(34) synthase MnmH [Bacteroidota bacterium]